jgi:hypothetical protein
VLLGGQLTGRTDSRDDLSNPLEKIYSPDGSRPRRASQKEAVVPLQDHHQIVSVDDHLIEHPRVFQDRLPEKFKQAGPRILEQDR